MAFLTDLEKRLQGLPVPENITLNLSVGLTVVALLTLLRSADFPLQLPAVSPQIAQHEFIPGYTLDTLQVVTHEGIVSVSQGMYLQLQDGRVMQLALIVPRIATDTEGRSILEASHAAGYEVQGTSEQGYQVDRILTEFDFSEVASVLAE